MNCLESIFLQVFSWHLDDVQRPDNIDFDILFTEDPFCFLPVGRQTRHNNPKNSPFNNTDEFLHVRKLFLISKMNASIPNFMFFRPQRAPKTVRVDGEFGGGKGAEEGVKSVHMFHEVK